MVEILHYSVTIRVISKVSRLMQRDRVCRVNLSTEVLHGQPTS